MSIQTPVTCKTCLLLKLHGPVVQNVLEFHVQLILDGVGSDMVTLKAKPGDPALTNVTVSVMVRATVTVEILSCGPSAVRPGLRRRALLGLGSSSSGQGRAVVRAFSKFMCAERNEH
jgi:hypothetical protein